MHMTVNQRLHEHGGSNPSLPTKLSDIDMATFDENDLSFLLDLIRGDGKFKFFGNAGFHAYPGMDENQDALYALCEELERRGLIKRIINEPLHVVFVGINKPD